MYSKPEMTEVLPELDDRCIRDRFPAIVEFLRNSIGFGDN